MTWADYERMLAMRGDKSAPRLTYLRGTLEIMSRSKDHEAIKTLIGCLLETWCLDRGVDLMGYGSWTIKDQDSDRGVEPDECYVFGTEPRERPQLAIEVEGSGRSLDKLEVYRKLQVDEVWSWRDGVIHLFVLQGDRYLEIPRSQVLPDLDVGLLASFLDRPSITQAVRDFRAALAIAKL